MPWRDEQVLAQGFRAEGALSVDQLAADQGCVHQSPQCAPQVGRYLQEDASQDRRLDQKECGYLSFKGPPISPRV